MVVSQDWQILSLLLLVDVSLNSLATTSIRSMLFHNGTDKNAIFLDLRIRGLF